MPSFQDCYSASFFGQQIFHPLWFNPIQNVTLFLVFSLFVGIAQIALGLALELVNFILKRDYLGAISGSLPRIAFYAGSIYLISVYQLNFGAWLRGPILFSLVPLVLVIIGKPLASLTIRAVAPSTSRPLEQPMITQSFLEGSDLATRLLSNTISYTRILALLMVHWALLLATYAIAGIVAPASVFGPVLSAIIIVAGNAFVLAFEGLIVFVQALRLHFYEWFSRFFKGTGTQFNPFKHEHVYSEIDLRKQ